MMSYDLSRGESTRMGLALSAVGSRLEARGRKLRRSAALDLGMVREFVRLLDQCFGELNRAAGIEDEQDALIRRSALQGSFPVLVFQRSGEGEFAASFLVETWRRTAETFGALLPLDWPQEVAEAATPYCAFEPAPVTQELLPMFQIAVFELFRDASSQAHGREILRRLMVLLGLSYDQLGRAFSVSGETVRRWERGSHPIPDERLPDLAQADAALSRLLEIFRAERLLQGVRRKAELFEGETALDWILRGRIGDVAGRYETALAYQG
jgi:transcriptional regulator with XRE-family HTH domain